jgi:hypothetical protein
MKLNYFQKILTIHAFDEDDYDLTTDNGVDVDLSEEQQKELVKFVWKNKPELIRDIICKNCPEHIGMIEQENYCLNKVERGK